MAGTLLLNINNSFTKAAFWKNGSLRPLGRKPTEETDSAQFEKWISRCHPDQIVVASVVPEVEACLKTSRSLPIHFITHRSPLEIEIRFPQPGTIGADRLCNACAVAATGEVPAVVVDYGTAVTFDIISAKKEYLGGVIAPGMRIFRDYLAERTALLPRVQISQPTGVVGKSTREAMRSGAYFGYRGLVKEILEEIRSELKAKQLAIIATGGDSSLFKNEDTLFHHHDPDLTFKGMGLVAARLPSLL